VIFVSPLFESRLVSFFFWSALCFWVLAGLLKRWAGEFPPFCTVFFVFAKFTSFFFPSLGFSICRFGNVLISNRVLFLPFLFLDHLFFFYSFFYSALPCCYFFTVKLLPTPPLSTLPFFSFFLFVLRSIWVMSLFRFPRRLLPIFYLLTLSPLFATRKSENQCSFPFTFFSLFTPPVLMRLLASQHQGSFFLTQPCPFCPRPVPLLTTASPPT